MRARDECKRRSKRERSTLHWWATCGAMAVAAT
jgi:hypothetical protein